MTPVRRGSTASADSHPRRRSLLVATIIVLAGGALRLGLAVATDGSPAVLDETAYLRVARTLVAEGRFEGTFRPPLYPAFMAAIFAVGGGTLAIRVVQALLATASIALVHRIAGRAVGSGAALAAAAWVAADPVLIMFSHRLWSETLFVALLLCGVDLLTAPRPSSPAGGAAPVRAPAYRALAGGVCLGLAALTRPVLLTFVPFIAVWALADAGRGGCRGRARWKSAGTSFARVVAAMLLTIAPWTVRNALVARAFIPIDSNGPFNLLVGSQPAAAFVAKDNYWSQRRFGLVDGRPYELAVRQAAAAAQRTAVRTALANIASDPAGFARKSAWEAGHLWTLDSFLLRHLRNGWYGPGVSATVVRSLTLYSVAFTAAMTLLACVGLAAAPGGSVRTWTLASIAHACLAFGLTYALSRYAVPLRPLLAAFAAAPLLSPRAALAVLRGAGWRSPRTWGLVAAGVLLLVVWAADAPLVYDMLGSGGERYRFRME